MNDGFLKNIIIAEFCGGGEKIVMVYTLIHDRSKGLTVIAVAMVGRQ